MSQKIDDRIVVDEHLESYAAFLDEQWARKIVQLADNTKFNDCVFDLCKNWKAVHATYIVPWFTVTNSAGIGNSILQGHDSMALTLVKALEKRLTDEMDGKLNPSQLRELERIIRKIGNETRIVEKRTHEEITLKPDDIWKSFISCEVRHEFGFILWGSQRICYGAIYHAYEDFIRQCIQIVVGKNNMKIWCDVKELKDYAYPHFGNKLVDDCLDSPDVQIARYVRDALAHNGGRESERLKKRQHGIKVEDGVLQIMPSNTRELFNLLKVQAYKFVEKGITLPGMK